MPFATTGLRLVLQRQRDGTQGHAIIVGDDIGEGAVRPPLYGRGWDDHDLAQGLDEHAGIDELARPELQVGVGKIRLHAHGAGGLVDLIVDDLQAAAVEYGLAVRLQRLDADGTGGERGVDVFELLLAAK